MASSLAKQVCILRFGVFCSQKGDNAAYVNLLYFVGGCIIYSNRKGDSAALATQVCGLRVGVLPHQSGMRHDLLLTHVYVVGRCISNRNARYCCFV